MDSKLTNIKRLRNNAKDPSIPPTSSSNPLAIQEHVAIYFYLELGPIRVQLVFKHRHNNSICLRLAVSDDVNHGVLLVDCLNYLLYHDARQLISVSQTPIQH
jgi:hypothetical protein